MTTFRATITLTIVTVLFLTGCQSSAPAPVVAAATVQPRVERSDLIGAWSGTDSKGEQGAIVLREDGSADLLIKGQSLYENVIRGKGTLTYAFDSAATPATLDIIAKRSDGRQMTFHGIVGREGSDSIKLRMPLDGSKPRDFSEPDDDTLILRRSSSNMLKPSVP